jgi:hypothetical protein
MCGLGWHAAADRRQTPRADAGWSTSSRSLHGIHFYTQWFERLGATPLSALLGGKRRCAANV